MTDTNLSITENTEDKSDNATSKLFLKGRITSSDTDILKRKLDEVLKAGCERIVLNMQDISFLASGGIRVLLMYYKIASSRGSSFYIEKPSENVKNVLGMVALDEMLLK